MSVDYLLHESSVGYAVFKVAMQPDTIGNRLKEVQEKSQDLAHFGKMVKLVSFAPWQSAEQALSNANEISEGIVSDYLRDVLETSLPKPDRKNTVTIGVADKVLAGSIKEDFPGVQCETGETSEITADLLRGLRLHSQKLLKNVAEEGERRLQEGDVERASLALGHGYSRGKVKFSVNRNDNHIIQAIATLDHLDKAVNTFAMRCREWYSWHFPELVKIVSDNHQYARLAILIADKKSLTEDDVHRLAAVVNEDEGAAQQIINAAKTSMGQDISEQDMDNVMAFARRVVSLSEYRKTLSAYLIAKMGVVAPNLASLIGETVGARLISHAGSLTNLAKYPASTVQILGAEKALFRALKTKGNTPKYGLIYHSSFIGRAGTRNKGRISRFLANKCSIASRIDNFSETPSVRFGQALKQQVEDRLEFYASGKAPMKNSDAMRAAMDSVLAEMDIDDHSGTVAVPPVDTEMNDVLPGSSSNKAAEGEVEAARKKSKEEKKLHKEERRKLKEDKKKRKRAAEGVVDDESEDESSKRKEKKDKERRKKHKHEK